MRTIVLSVSATTPAAGDIARAAEVIRRGGLVAFPTETVYGLGANALDPEAIAGIFAAKGRPAHNPLIVHVTGAGQAADLAAGWPDAAARLAARFWPGPLTFVLPKRPHVPDIVTAGGPTVALRAPAHPVAAALIAAAGVPIAAPSANRSNRVSPTKANHVMRTLADRIDMLLDAGPTPGGIESTVIDLTAEVPHLLRPGLVTPADIEGVIGPIVRGPASTDGPLRSPGMLHRHYAPQAALECVPGDGAERACELEMDGERVALLTFGARDTAAARGVMVVAMPNHAETYASRLYAVLHELDAAEVDRIVVALPPDTDDWLAVRDRLQRASARP